jgi:Fur family peroxide stress response transcriptional regulator
VAVSKEKVRDRMDAFMEMCRRSGTRATHQRREVFREVARTEEHPDVETIYGRVRKRIPTVSLDTVYRTLSLLEERGLLRRVEVFSGPARFDANTDSHHHFICTRCGLVRDFADEQMGGLEVPEEVSSWGKVRSVHVQVRGICADCLDAE